MSVADFLKYRLVVARGKTVTEVAAELGIGRPAFSNVINGNADLSIELALTIEDTFTVDARRLLIQQLDESIARARSARTAKR